MINVSAAWHRALANDQRDYQIEIQVTLKDGRVRTITNSRIWNGTFKIDDAVSSDNDFQVGSAIINKCNFSLNLIEGGIFMGERLMGAEVIVSIGVQTDSGLETIRKGTYVIVNDPTYSGDLMNMECYDNMYFFDVPYSQNETVYPATADTIVREMCADLGITLNTYDFPNKNTVIEERPTEEATTYREVLSYVAQICGCFARFNAYGELELKWYNQSELTNAMTGLDGGGFDPGNPYISGDDADGGSFNPWSTGDVVDGGGFSWGTSLHYLTAAYSRDLSADDVVITGIKIYVKTKEANGTSQAIKEYMSGTSGYLIEIKDNPFITESNAQAIANRLGQQLIGFTFRKAKISHSSDPSIEAGDVAIVFDRQTQSLTPVTGQAHPIVISRTIFSTGGSQETISSAQTPARNSAPRYTAEIKNYVELRERIRNERTTRQQAEADLRDAIANANGLYETQVTDQTTGAVTTYMHNKELLSESDIQIMISDAGVTVTPDGGTNWYGLRVNGDLIARILTAIGINADWINTGQLVIKDANDNVTLFADADTGDVTINADVVAKSLTAQRYVVIDGTSNSYFKIPITNQNNSFDGYGFIVLDKNGFKTKSLYYGTHKKSGSIAYNYYGMQVDIGGQDPDINLNTTSPNHHLVGGAAFYDVDTEDCLNIAPNLLHFRSKQTPSMSALFDMDHASGSVKLSMKDKNGNNILDVSSSAYVQVQIGSSSNTTATYTSLVYGKTRFYNDATFDNNITASGTKSRLVETDNYSDRLLYCYETPSPLFGDIGDGVIADDGNCYVSIDPIFSETISTNQYQVFLQKYGQGECYVKERHGAYFVVSGTPGLQFAWEIKAKQLDFMQKRLDRKMDDVDISNAINYVNDAQQHINEIMKERTSL